MGIKKRGSGGWNPGRISSRIKRISSSGFNIILRLKKLGVGSQGLACVIKYGVINIFASIVIPAKAGIQKNRLDSGSSPE
jgi:hypothetical protein